MLFRDNNGNIINISRLNYNNDKAYYDKLRNIIKTPGCINPSNCEFFSVVKTLE